MTIDASARGARILRSRQAPAKMSRRIAHRAAVLLTVPLLIVGGCATAPSERASLGGASSESVRVVARTQSVQLDAAQENRILALDPERISEADVRTTLALAPAPRIVLVHGGVVGVYLLMESFAKFLVGMGYPEAKIRDPHNGAYSQNPYGSSERLAGAVAWYYERDAMRPMLIGHSQGGMQTVKVLHELAGSFGERIAVWNPVTDRREERHTIIDPITHMEKPVVGLSVSYASVVGAGGIEFFAPSVWSMAGRLRTIPDSVDEFTGFAIAGDVVAWTAPGGATAADEYRTTGNAVVHNVNLPASYNHVFVPSTQHLAADPRMRDWINRHATGNPADLSSLPEGLSDNVLWAANVWHGIKKHWCLEAQRLIRARRHLDTAPPSQSAQR
ncbi:MAG TPA: hypothetical protein VGR65_02920 [Casimicrobiaceae bacterium]|jgi:hypothetical protein|nr:hypothetical protein [Casimicrobiaceae bacterium]